jgi:hypothetical protein
VIEAMGVENELREMAFAELLVERFEVRVLD